MSLNCPDCVSVLQQTLGISPRRNNDVIAHRKAEGSAATFREQTEFETHRDLADSPIIVCCKREVFHVAGRACSGNSGKNRICIEREKKRFRSTDSIRLECRYACVRKD